MKKILKNILLYILFPSLFPLLFTSNINSKLFIYLEFIGYVLLAIYFVFKYKKELINNIRSFDFKDIKYVLFIFIFGLSLMILANYIINYHILPNHISNNELANRELLKNYKIIYIILLSSVIPFIEEIVFRLEFKKCIKNKYAYLIITSTIFSLLHNLNDTKIIELLYFVPYFIMGYSLSLIYYKTNNILYSILMHIINNSITLLIVLL